MKLEFIREGSAKKIYRAGPGLLAFRFTDHFSVFDVGRHPQTILWKAEATCACAVKSFEVARQVGVPTHFVERVDATTIIVKEAQVITDRLLTLRDENYVVPAEFISRFRVAGSVLRDFKAGKKKPTDYGFPTDDVPSEGTPFPRPIHQFTTKFEKVDREISDEEACAMAGLSTRDVEEYWSMIDRLNGAISYEFMLAGYAHFDGKMECLMGPGREKMIGDVFGTPDEDRLCPTLWLDRGKVEHYSKEFLRELLIKNGYYEELMKARRAGEADPPFYPLTEEEIEEAINRYLEIARDYAGADLIY